MTTVVWRKSFIPLLALLSVIFGTSAHADDCAGLAKALGQTPPTAVAGSLEGTRCGNWYAQTPGGTWNLPFLTSVKGQSVTYVTYWFGQPVKVTPNAKWNGSSAVAFDIPLNSLTSNSMSGMVHYDFKVMPGGDIDAKSVSAPDNAPPITFVSQPKFAPYPQASK